MPESIVNIVKCSEYDKILIKNALQDCLKPLGGMKAFVKPGMKVFLKPNMLSAKEPERGITTHPLLLEVIAEEVRNAGGILSMGDSPAGALGNIKRFWKNTGYLELSERLNIPLINFEGGGVCARSINGKTYHIAKALAESDIIINISKLKTHFFTLYTGAIKNMFGSIPGLRKGTYHKEALKPYKFSQILTDIFAVTKPVLNIMDAVTGMEGNGPSSGHVRNIGLLIASTDAVALDSVCQSIIGYGQGEIATTAIAAEKNLGNSNFDSIKINGPSIDSIKINDFELPSNRYIKMIPDLIVNSLSRFIWVHPAAVPEKCTNCKICVKSCPVSAMESNGKFPEIDYDKCINCDCCFEVCPEDAIEQKFSWLAKKFK